ncbi:MAG TPA: DUF1330 domain-containing protein [Gaiellaceae bacterium]|jgi:uncharacterized protein (DUF1330 family)|nr:DUF1330 domain-containing protein [Gaiellaceae bacterium]
MPAYVIVDADVSDMDAYQAYLAASPGAIASGGGRFIARGGKTVTLEGEWHPRRVVVLEFESLEAARQWYASEDYQTAKGLREGIAELKMIAVEGV